MPYAAKAVIEHEFDVDHLNVWVTFRHPMDQSLYPSLSLWILECDDVPVDVVSSVWQDEFTILLTSDTVVGAPDRVTLEYNGPSSNLVTTWEKQWEPWGPIFSADLASYKQPSFVDRSDASAFDFLVGDLTTNGTYRDLDLSAIVPEGAKAVYLTGRIRDNLVDSQLAFKKNADASGFHGNRVYTQLANQYNSFQFIVPVDSSRVIQYYATNTIWDSIDIVINGWFF